MTDFIKSRRDPSVSIEVRSLDYIGGIIDILREEAPKSDNNYGLLMEAADELELLSIMIAEKTTDLPHLKINYDEENEHE